ncbi:head GIN domain-containing protein [Lutibacter sp. HS1-25]|uniref:head GIN domain-containing protein n=1 Tax=Lutibacter sp. HS1-25 TaxID=2485000 RepID=UPI0013E919D4|nr:head GIN domain-containing protein [Lutibacter sp. HS1-25]
MKTISQLIIIATFIFSIGLNAQYKSIKANGNIITQTRTVANFSKISISGSFDVTLTKGNEGNISINASENLMDIIETKVENGILKIKFKNGINVKNHKTIFITVFYDTVNSISLGGSGDIHSSNTLNANDLELILSGSGGFNLAVSTTNLNINISGSGNMNIAGKTAVLTCAVSGSGNIKTTDLTANIVHAKISGSGNIKVHAVNEINAKSSGSGNIIYTGNPTIIKSNSSGSGSIQKRD